VTFDRGKSGLEAFQAPAPLIRHCLADHPHAQPIPAVVRITAGDGGSSAQAPEAPIFHGAKREVRIDPPAAAGAARTRAVPQLRATSPSDT
jgi:hypothetical protein